MRISFFALHLIVVSVAIPVLHAADNDIPPGTDINIQESAEQEEEPDQEDDEDTNEEVPFLEPYYESEDTSGCSLTGCSGPGDIIRIIAGIDVRYNSDPAQHRGVRAILGSKGNAAALNIRFGLTSIELETGYSAAIMFRTPSPLGLDILYQRVNTEEGSSGFSLIYTGIVSQLAYNSPLQLMFGAQFVFPVEDDRETLTGGGFGLLGQYNFPRRIGIAFDYRLVWVRNLPLHRGEMRVSWSSAPVELFVGYNILRNCNGVQLNGPIAGVGLVF